MFQRNEFDGDPGGEDHVVALVVRRGETGPGLRIRMVDLGAAEPIGQSLGQLRRRLMAKGDVGPPAGDLHQLLWAPLLPHLEEVREVLLIPDGMLHLLPFARLAASAAVQR